MDQTESAVGAELASRTWRVIAYIYAPMLSTSVLPPQVGSQFTFTSRLAPKAVNYRGMAVALFPPPSEVSTQLQLPPGVELAFLAADVTGSLDALQAVESAVEVFEVVIDSLSFQLAAEVRLGQFEVLDITAPVDIGDEREIRIFSGPLYGTNIRSIEMESVHGAVSVTLPDDFPESDTRTAAALRWFNKSMSTNLLHDAFIFLWIALEILVDLSPISVEAPYQARCRHAIKYCPECGVSTSKEVRGPTIRQYLEVSFGMDAETSKALWAMRQMMHGSINFEAAKLQDLPKLIQPLRAAVADGIKRRLEIDKLAAPVIASSGLSINPAMGPGGTRGIKADDLQPLTTKAEEALTASNLDPQATSSQDLSEDSSNTASSDG
jgi:hypothetical protein